MVARSVWDVILRSKAKVKKHLLEVEHHTSFSWWVLENDLHLERTQIIFTSGFSSLPILFLLLFAERA